MRTSKTYLLFAVILLVGCIQGSQKEVQNSYKIIDIVEDGDCKVYAMLFEEGNDYLFRFALSGTCKKLKSEEYFQLYDSFLKNNVAYASSLDSTKIILEAYDFILPELDSVIIVTERNLNLKADIIEKWNEGFKIKLRKR